MFWKNKYEYSIIDDEITDKDLQEFIKENNIFLDIVDNSTRWCAFAQHYGHKHGLSSVHATSFSYMVSLFMTGMGISASTEIYFKEEKIELDLVDEYNSINEEEIPEKEKVIKMFDSIFKLYSEEISEYEYATERVSFKLTPSQMEKFLSLEGENNKQKFINLLEKI